MHRFFSVLQFQRWTNYICERWNDNLQMYRNLKNLHTNDKRVKSDLIGKMYNCINMEGKDPQVTLR